MTTTDPLCRPLTLGEQKWLAQSALICLVAELPHSHHNDAETCESKLRRAVESSRRQQPFLNVCIDPAALRFKRTTGPIPFSVDDLPPRDVRSNLHLSPPQMREPKAFIRAIARRQLDIGVDRTVSLVRVHYVSSTSPSMSSHLILLCDHLCFDAKSLVIWMVGLVRALNSNDDEAARPLEGVEMFPFVDWATLIPEDITLPPFAPPFASVKLVALSPSAEEAAAASIADEVVTVPPEVFAALKARAKAANSRLNAPLMVAFFASIAEAASRQQPTALQPPLNVRAVCAVDLRPQLHLPSNFMNNSASCVPAYASITPSEEDLWPAALEAQGALLKAIEDGEAYRLHDMTKRAAYHEFGPYFDIGCLWSNVGHVDDSDSDGAGRLLSVECHISGTGSNPVVSAHAVETNGVLNLTISYSPVFHAADIIQFIGQRFLHHVAQLGVSTKT